MSVEAGVSVITGCPLGETGWLYLVNKYPANVCIPFYTSVTMLFLKKILAVAAISIKVYL